MARASIAPGSVHVWEADLRAVPASLSRLLSAEERERAQAILPPGPRALWPRSRALLRVLLARYSGQDAASLEIATEPRGKPLLSGLQGRHFNLSHSGHLALYAFSDEGPLGVDVERAGRRSAAVLSAWTRREAAAKCQGGGLGGDVGATAALWVGELDLRGEGFAAIARCGAPRAVERLRWTP